MNNSLNFSIFKEVEDVQEDAFEVLNRAPKKVVAKDVKEAQAKAFRFFKHPLFFLVRAGTLLFIALILSTIIVITPNDLLLGTQKSYLLSLVGLIYAAMVLKKLVFWRLNSYLVVPNEGLYRFKAKSLFSLSSENIPFDKIRTIDIYHKGAGSQIFGYGDIVLASIITNKEENSGSKLTLKQIYKPKKVVAKLKPWLSEDSNSL